LLECSWKKKKKPAEEEKKEEPEFAFCHLLNDEQIKTSPLEGWDSMLLIIYFL